MNIKIPEKLNKGDTVGFLSLAGCIEDTQRILNAEKYFRDLGYNVVISDTTFMQDMYNAGTVEKRLNALHSFFMNDDIKAIIATRGGYGSIQLINKIDYELIRNNPKIFAGSSDITALLLMLYKKSGLITFHSPMLYNDFSTDADSSNSLSFFNATNYSTDFYHSDMTFFNTYFEGVTNGILWGGNLCTITSLCGQDFIPDEKFILFVEEIKENVYKIDRMFQQLLNIEKFQDNLAGIVLGDFTEIDNDNMLSKFFHKLALETKIPMCDGLHFGHGSKKLTIPIGVKSVFNANECSIKIIK